MKLPSFSLLSKKNMEKKKNFEDNTQTTQITQTQDTELKVD